MDEEKFHWAFVFYRADGSRAHRIDYHHATVETARRTLTKSLRNVPHMRCFRLIEADELSPEGD